MKEKFYIVGVLLFIILVLSIEINAEYRVNTFIRENNSTKVSDPLNKNVLVNKQNYLPRDFVPYDLIQPDVNHLITGDLPRNKLRFEAALMLENLFYQAELDQIELFSVSSYRSFHRQQNIFMKNVLQRGFEVANQTSALPGESEHQTGLAVDLTSPEVAFRLTSEFANTKAGKWLEENSHYYGFIIRYPVNKEAITGYNHEPWHLRYIGVKDAVTVVESNLTYEEYYFQNYLTIFPLKTNHTNYYYTLFYQDFAKQLKEPEKREELKEDKKELKEQEPEGKDEVKESEKEEPPEEEDKEREIRIFF